MSKLILLQQHVAVCDRILQFLGESNSELKDIDGSESSTTRIDFLPPFPPVLAVVKQRLGAKYVDDQVIERICEAYYSQAASWRKTILGDSSWVQARLSQLSGQRIPTGEKSLQNAFIASYLDGLRSMETGILSVIDDRIRQDKADSEAASCLLSDGSSSHPDDNGRGHGTEAVAILEAAYAYTTNISQAEKRRLAQANGLQPRQVVIWFQNRRNRKVKGRENTVQPLSPTIDSTSTIVGFRKRKVSCNEEGQPRQPGDTTCSDKKIRSIGQPPGPLDRRLFSSSSNSSPKSSVDGSASSSLIGWNAFGKPGKQRNVSSDCSNTSYTSPSLASSDTTAPACTHSNGPCEMQRLRPYQPLAHARSSQVNHPVDSFSQAVGQSAFEHPKHDHFMPLHIAHMFQENNQDPSNVGGAPTVANSYIFSEGCNVPRLDFDDLKFDVADLEKNLFSPPKFVALTPVGPAQIWSRAVASDEGLDSRSGIVVQDHQQGQTSAGVIGDTPGLTSAHASQRPYDFVDIAEALNDGKFDIFHALTALPTFQFLPSEAKVHLATDSENGSGPSEADQNHLGLPLPFPSDTGPSAHIFRGREPFTPPSRVKDAMSPEDFKFTFDFAELGLDRTFEEVRQSYRWAEEEAKMYSTSEMEEESAAQMSSDWETTQDADRGDDGGRQDNQ